MFNKIENEHHLAAQELQAMDVPMMDTTVNQRIEVEAGAAKCHNTVDIIRTEVEDNTQVANKMFIKDQWSINNKTSAHQAIEQSTVSDKITLIEM